MCPGTEVDLELKRDKFEVGMKLLDVLKRIPPEHYTEYKGRYILVKELIKILEKELVEEHRIRRERVRGNKKKWVNE